MSDELREIELRNGVLAFDGRVLERFGFGEPGREGTRMHVRRIARIELDGAKLEVRSTGRDTINARLEFGDDQRPEIEAFLADVRAAAPSLEERA